MNPSTHQTHPQLELDRQLCFPLHAATRAVTRAYGPLLEDVGLTYPQYLTMLALWSSPDAPLTVSELGHRLRLDSGTLTPLLKRLEGQGHVSRRRDPDDERRVLIGVTDHGWQLRERVAHVPTELLGAVHLTRSELVELRRLLDKVIAELDEPPER